MFKNIATKLFDIIGSKDWRPHLGKDGLVMRRRLPGQWEYRTPTVEEIEEAISWQAVK
ncbi:hypothetical protein [Rhizobium phaseoli]|uniref:hypothetical protein n=1 Tax=Rhizobium phaseoli TaxID=396 RepID=UPI0025559D56|nr:hypothetical protein [Rhizobium phaseoli]MDK4729351.1 hypothetical protein [Rhizobium phaseoli]